jgi:signal peptidase II
MEKVHRLRPGNWRDVVFGSIAVFIIIADQLTKAWVQAEITLNTIYFDAGFFQIVHIQNTGVSFGLFKGHVEIVIAVVFIEILAILLIVYLLRNRLAFLDSMLMRVGLGLIMGGAIGNQIDRLIQGHVTDFFDLKVWPAFNVADSAAVVGTIIIAYCILFKSGLSKRRK